MYIIDVIQTIFMHQNLDFLRIDFPRKKVISSNTPTNKTNSVINNKSITTNNDVTNTTNKKISSYFIRDNKENVEAIDDNNDINL